MLNSSLMMSLRTIEFLRVCDWILQVYVLCDVNCKGRSWKASRISFSFFLFLFYLNQMFKWIYMSFVIETSLRRFAPLITLCWCNTTVVFIFTRLSFSVCLDQIESYRISMWSFDLSKSDNNISIERQTSRPSVNVDFAIWVLSQSVFATSFSSSLCYRTFSTYVTSQSLLCNLNHNRQVFISIFEHGTEQIIIVYRYIDIYIYVCMYTSYWRCRWRVCTHAL